MIILFNINIGRHYFYDVERFSHTCLNRAFRNALFNVIKLVLMLVKSSEILICENQGSFGGVISAVARPHVITFWKYKIFAIHNVISNYFAKIPF